MTKRAPHDRPAATVLALDLEGTLITSAIHCAPRPGLYGFLERCNQMFDRLVIFSTVREEVFRQIAYELARRMEAPHWFASLECVEWPRSGVKDLALVRDAELQAILLLDDQEVYVVPGQETHWISIPEYAPPAASGAPMDLDDAALLKAISSLEERTGTDAYRRLPEDGVIRFHKRDRATFGFLSNFHPGRFMLDGLVWETVEHYYQAQKSEHPDYRAAIRACPGPSKAKMLGRSEFVSERGSWKHSWFFERRDAVRPDWETLKEDVMRRAVLGKFSQNAGLRHRLLCTDGAQLEEDSDKDAF